MAKQSLQLRAVTLYPGRPKRLLISDSLMNSSLLNAEAVEQTCNNIPISSCSWLQPRASLMRLTRIFCSKFCLGYFIHTYFKKSIGIHLIHRSTSKALSLSTEIEVLLVISLYSPPLPLSTLFPRHAYPWPPPPSLKCSPRLHALITCTYMKKIRCKQIDDMFKKWWNMG